jgi:hypothetical protein
MRSLIVVESVYGNTASVARAIHEGLSQFGDSVVCSVDEIDAATLHGADLMLVGAPTHAWGLPRRRTWPAPSATALVAPDSLIREWLDTGVQGRGRLCAAFATRLDKPSYVTGSAAKGIARKLVRNGWHALSPSTSFVVTGNEGPLGEGELARAQAWGEMLGRMASRLLDAAGSTPSH